jgi:hypothetical protein
MAWNYVDEMIMRTHTTYYTGLTLVCCIGNIFGAWVTDLLSKKLRSLRYVAALGCVLSSPMVFMFWQLLKGSAAGTGVTNG